MDRWLGEVIQAGLEGDVHNHDVPLLFDISGALALNDMDDAAVWRFEKFPSPRRCVTRCWIRGRSCSDHGSGSRRNSSHLRCYSHLLYPLDLPRKYVIAYSNFHLSIRSGILIIYCIGAEESILIKASII